MTDRERLIELINQAKDKTPCSYNPNIDCEGIVCSACENGSIADHLLANGVIVPPCKVGDSIWLIKSLNWQRTEWGIQEGKVSMIQQKADKSWKFRITENGSVSDYTVDYISKTVFLTKEEAEQALKEREKQ